MIIYKNMELTLAKTIKELLAKHESRASKKLGQNFLADKNVLQKIIDSSNIVPDDIIIEVGPGLGTLTRELAMRAKKVVAIEKDRNMIEILEETLNDFKNIEIIQGDALKIFSDFPNYKVIANIPYYLTSPLIRKFLESKNPPKEMVLMLQKEVAQRICAVPPKMSLLSVSVQFYATAKIVLNVSKNSFWPAPKVDSAVIKIIPKLGKPSMPAEQFFKIVKAGFLHPRKQLAGNLSKGLKLSKENTEKWLQQNNINPKQRAETLSIDDWLNLAKI
jgi:16S rRNA (adenine1518-N6/adenine1519-N6)-dimethyltransferase